MKIVVDTNIVFSAIVNSSGKIGDLLMNSDGIFEFHACDFMRSELFKHHGKLLKISKLAPEQLDLSKQLIFSRIAFSSTALVPVPLLLKAEELLSDIVPDDTEHAALALHFDAPLWTGDLKLINGLRQKGIDWAVSTAELFLLRQKT